MFAFHIFYRVPIDLRSVIYCSAIRQGGKREVDFLTTRLNKSNVVSEQLMIKKSLKCTRQIWLLQKYLEWTLDDSTGASKYDRIIVFSSVARNDIGFLLAKTFFFEKIDRFAQMYVSEHFYAIRRNS